MNKNYNLITDVPFDKVTGPIPHNLTNDYMFKVVMQECPEARAGLIGALLYLDPATLEVDVENPIELGKSIAGKDFYLDVKVTVNKTRVMNLEMQVRSHLALNDRSLSYCCRSFDSLNKGENYANIKPFHQIVFTCFDMFPDNNKFYDTFRMTSKDTSRILTDKFLLSVVNLRRIGESSNEDRQYKLDRWCRLITAGTWEELKEIAKGDAYMEATAKKSYFFSAEFDIQEEAIRREEYYNYVHSLEDKIAEKDSALAEKDSALAEKDSALAEKDAEIAELKRKLDLLS